MSQASLLWRAIVRAERYLPARPLGQAGEWPATRARSRRQRIGMALVLLLPALFNVAHVSRRALGEGWPMWRPLLLDLTLVIAGGALVAVAVAGAMAWRRAAHA